MDRIPLFYATVTLCAKPVHGNRPDTVGQPPNTLNHASYLPALKAQKSLESNAGTAAVSHGNRMTNSTPTFFKTDKPLLTCRVLLTSNGVSLHEGERVVI